MLPISDHNFAFSIPMAPKDETNSDSSPSWFTPKRLLLIFCLINLVNYIDRGAIASNGVNGTARMCNVTCVEGGFKEVRSSKFNDGFSPCLNGTVSSSCDRGSGIQGHFDLNNFEDGVLSSAFMVGLLVSCPVFAHLAHSANPFRLIGVGLTVWTLAVIGCGFSVNFWTITICRMLVGVGEASFISLAPPFIDDNAPPTQKTAWLGIFYMCISSGYAIGYIYGGIVGSRSSWRYAFFGEAILMLPFAILGFLIKPLQLKGFDSSEAAHNQASTKPKSGLDQISSFFKDLKSLLSQNIFVVNVLGYIAYNFVLGAYSYWGPKAGKAIYNMQNADFLFGGITVVTGVLGTLAGGFALDRLTSTITNSFKLLFASTLLGAMFCFGAFCLKDLYPFLALFAIGEILVFATQGPVNFTCLHCVKPSLRPLSMALSTVAIHVFGDVPSAPLVGVLQDRINNWRVTTLSLTSIFFLAAAIWFIGIFLPSVDKFDEESDNQSTRAVLQESNNQSTRAVLQ